VKKNVRASKVLPDLFGEESLVNFLLEVERVNASLIHRDPTEDGWSFTGELRGTGKNAPELFRIYEKAGSKMVLLSDFVNRSVFNSSGATNPSRGSVRGTG
jgi:hypothetical protein